MRRSRHDIDLFTDNKRATADGNKNQTHSDIPGVGMRLAEMDLEPDAEDGDGDGEQDGVPFAAAVVAQDEAEDDGPDAGADGVDGRHVGGLGHGEVEGGLEELAEVLAVPDAEGGVEGGDHGVGEDDGAVFHECPGEEGDGGEEAFVDGEGDDEEAAGDEEGDDEWLAPFVRLVCVQAEC